MPLLLYMIYAVKNHLMLSTVGLEILTGNLKEKYIIANAIINQFKNYY